MAKENRETCFNGNTLLTDEDLYLFNEGSHFRLYEKFGAQIIKKCGREGTFFSVWAPNAESVFVIGDFNGWNKTKHPLTQRDHSGIWEGFIPGICKGERYKYRIHSRHNMYKVDKADPFAFYNEISPKTSSIVWNFKHQWDDEDWMKNRERLSSQDSPMAIYELHLGSWMRVPEEENRSLNYKELGSRLAEYASDMGFTHVEFLPVMEHPFYGSWGYQVNGYFAPTSRYGTPDDFMFLIDQLHQHGIGVILDWVPSHFPDDEHGLGYFDGTHLFEHSEERQRIHPDWGSLIFNYGRHEVQSFLISNALFWLDKYHVDGLRVDAVASMLYLDYGRKDGEWIPNKYRGRENLEAISFLKRFNETVYEHYPSVHTIAEESTSWPMVSRPTYIGGLGFGMKWDMGWMHDTLEYFSKDPVYRKYQHDKLTFRIIYAFHENFVLPFSHDEVVHGKGSLLRKMPGDDWQKFANLRLLLGYMYAQPGKKLLFMGGEIGQWNEWYHETSLDWDLLDYPFHRGVQQWVKDLNNLYRNEPALYEHDFEPAGFEWIDCNDSQQSTISLIRNGSSDEDTLIIVCNFTPIPRHDFLVGAPKGGFWRELLNSDALDYGGSGQGNLGHVAADSTPFHGRPNSFSITIPPLSTVFFKAESQ
ncbi:MAG: 1,4-alpha-glucan branching protein GlgB [Deltaproteobacteria bacterium]|nr:1,4-alpha-glucan branching protein GlgB [Deltaproteobacteria bacterium]MBW1860920.1 1,4-alpha-glucan branching protein GlgB [Deltaproteobacteria bacterium]